MMQFKIHPQKNRVLIVSPAPSFDWETGWVGKEKCKKMIVLTILQS